MPTLRPLPLALAVVALGAALTSGCYSYLPVEQPSPGTTVRIHVPVTRAALGTRSREPETVDFEGLVLSASDSLVLETKSRREIGAFREIFELDTLRVATEALVGIEERRFSKPKTYAFTALVTAGAAGLVVAALNAAGAFEDDGPPGNGSTTQSALRLDPIVSSLFRLLGR
jgi:hypothetical protein